MKLIIQIPCYNEEDHLEATLAGLPRSIPGVAEIEVLVIDDGSEDNTRLVARQAGVHHIVFFPRNRGLAAAYMAGLDACFRLGADMVVNTDADNQYNGSDIQQLLTPILSGHADLVIGNRQTDLVTEFSPMKRFLQRWGSRVVRHLSGTAVADSTSGFRAMNRKAMSSLFVHNRFSYTLETIVQAGHLDLVVENVTIRTNPKSRPSRLFTSSFEYIRRNGLVLLRAYSMYWPLRTFGLIALGLFLCGMVLGVRFLYYYMMDPSVSSHIQSLMVGVGAVMGAFIVGLMALLGDLMATNRRLAHETLERVRRLEAGLLSSDDGVLEGVECTGAAPWRAEKGITTDGREHGGA